MHIDFKQVKIQNIKVFSLAIFLQPVSNKRMMRDMKAMEMAMWGTCATSPLTSLQNCGVVRNRKGRTIDCLRWHYSTSSWFYLNKEKEKT